MRQLGGATTARSAMQVLQRANLASDPSTSSVTSKTPTARHGSGPCLAACQSDNFAVGRAPRPVRKFSDRRFVYPLIVALWPTQSANSNRSWGSRARSSSQPSKPLSAERHNWQNSQGWQRPIRPHDHHARKAASDCHNRAPRSNHQTCSGSGAGAGDAGCGSICPVRLTPADRKRASNASRARCTMASRVMPRTREAWG